MNKKDSKDGLSTVISLPIYRVKKQCSPFDSWDHFRTNLKSFSCGERNSTELLDPVVLYFTMFFFLFVIGRVSNGNLFEHGCICSKYLSVVLYLLYKFG